MDRVARTRRHARAKGFTLVELLVTVVIMGLLSAVAVPNYSNAQDKAKNAAVQANVHSVQMAIEQYGVDTAGVYPKDETVLYNKVVKDSAYMGGGNFGRTPWDTQQAKGIVWPNASESAEIGDVVGTGQNLEPTKATNYGAISYTLAKGVTANERYVLVGTGKRMNKAIIASIVRNF